MSRWTLFALGTIEGEKVRRPKDPVAAWLLKNAPGLMPPEAVGSVLSMIRARTSVIDRMIEEEVHTSVKAGDGLDFWSVGCGFDARWYRIKTLMSDAVRKHFEIDVPGLLEVKSELLERSSYRQSWREIEVWPLVETEWTVRTRGHANLVCMEGASTRLAPADLRDLLRRIRKDAPNARVILDIPSFVSMLHSRTALPRAASGAELGTAAELDNPYRWRHKYFRTLGWDVREDLWLTGRPTVDPLIPGLGEVPGMEGIRILRLRATQDDALKRPGSASISLGPR